MPQLEGLKRPPVAVIDIGSNSIRLVVFDSDDRAPMPVFNEKVLCGLGRDMDSTGRLSEEGVVQALKALPRFVDLARSMGVVRIDMLATAAVREADNGGEFAARVRQVCGEEMEILSGGEEARLSALGLLSGTPDAIGVMGDLGGGSVELVRVTGTAIGPQTTLPIGPLRFGAKMLANPSKVKSRIDEAVDSVDWLAEEQGGAFYAIGGAWRSLARLHMIHVDYPLHVIHHYSVPVEKALDFAQFVSKLSAETLFKVHGLNRRRLETLPFAGMLLHRLLTRIRPKEVVMSAYGLREGSLFNRLSPEERARDPLIAACQRYALRRRVIAVNGESLNDWLSPLFPDADAEEVRLRLACCLLVDIGRGEHPDYRAEHTLMRVLRFPFVGVDHHQRAFMALASASRHAQLAEGEGAMPTVLALLDPALQARARAIGLAIRLAYTLSGGIAEVLDRFAIRREGDRVVLSVRDELGYRLYGEVVERRLGALAKMMVCERAVEAPPEVSAAAG